MNVRLMFWVTFPSLLLNCWSIGLLSRIASGLGNPLCTDDCTSRMERISYVRVLLEIDITVSLPTKLKVMDPNGYIFDQNINYEWWPKYCPTCCQIGHVCKVQPPNPVPKQNPTKQGKKDPKGVMIWKSKKAQPNTEHYQAPHLVAIEHVSSWDMRGFNKQFKQKELHRTIKKEFFGTSGSTVVLAILEHRATKQKEHNITRKKSKMQWLALGDNSFVFFHASVKSKIARNAITRLVMEKKEIIQTDKGIEDKDIVFYKRLQGKYVDQLPAIDLSIMKSGPILQKD
ncbi:hypothetical protein BC332_21760 [Capsicum chinense]|nr:hypothetical protein BC332_21760 [Capsicum chinense]